MNALPSPGLSAADMLETALKHHREGRPAEAESAYRAVLAADPADPNVPPLLGMLLLKVGRAAEAVPLLARAAEIRSDNSEARLAHANALYLAHRPGEAAEAYRALLAIWPGKASAWANLAESLRIVGDFAGALDAAEQALSFLPNFPAAQLARGNALMGLGRLVEAEMALSAVVAANPMMVQAQTSYAAVLLKSGRASAAVSAARRALELQPGLAEAEFVLGCALREQGDRAGAITHFSAATAHDPRHARAWLNLGNVFAETDGVEEAENAYRAALAVNPDYAEAHSALGCVLSQSGRIQEALQAFERAIALRPDFAEAHWNQGFTLLLGGDFARGWEKYEWRKRHDRFAKTFPTLSGPAWEGEALGGKRLLVYAEQGLGDTIQFARYAKPLAEKGAEVILACDAKLLRLLSGAPGIARATDKALPLPHYDCWVDQMSLPRLMGTGLDSIPSPGAYLAADPVQVRDWAGQLPPGIKIGLVWAGNPVHSNDARRSMPIAALRPVLQRRDLQFVSLQVGPRAGELASLRADVPDLSWRLKDFADTAAVIANLDLVIAVDTAVAHLAGALGKPVWLMVPHAPDFRWLLGRADTPWYGSMRLYRQRAPGDWASVAEAVAADLSKMRSASA